MFLYCDQLSFVLKKINYSQHKIKNEFNYYISTVCFEGKAKCSVYNLFENFFK